MNEAEMYSSIRKKSEIFLKKEGLIFDKNLPLLETGSIVRTCDEITDRVLVLFGVVATGFGFEKAKSVEWLRTENLDTQLENCERSHLQGLASDPLQKEDLVAQVESMWILSWVLQHTRTVNPLKTCDSNFVNSLPDIRRGESVVQYRSKSNLRKSSEVLQMLDTTYCLHWSLVENPLQTAFKKTKKYLIPARRRALEWLFSKEGWYDLELNT